MAEAFGDRLVAAIDAKHVPACVGLDPVWARLPAECKGDAGDAEPDCYESVAAAFEAFCRGVIEVVAPLVPVVKVNSAFFERYRAPGVSAYDRVIACAQSAGLVVIGDVKRADVGHSTVQYAEAHLAPPPAEAGIATPDAVTVNPYLGADGVQPFIEVARRHGRGLFVLVQTSNPTSMELQGQALAAGGPVALAVAALVREWSGGEGLVGQSGYSAVGAVVSPGPACPTAELRAAMPHSIFLVPGFGAQGRGAADVQACFRADGRGALVNASRSVIFPEAAPGQDWRSAVGAAARTFVEQLRTVAAGR